MESIIVNHLTLVPVQLLDHVKPGKVVDQDRCVHLDILQVLLTASIPAIVKTVVENRLKFFYSLQRPKMRIGHHSINIALLGNP